MFVVMEMFFVSFMERSTGLSDIFPVTVGACDTVYSALIILLLWVIVACV